MVWGLCGVRELAGKVRGLRREAIAPGRAVEAVVPGLCGGWPAREDTQQEEGCARQQAVRELWHQGSSLLSPAREEEALVHGMRCQPPGVHHRKYVQKWEMRRLRQ